MQVLGRWARRPRLLLVVATLVMTAIGRIPSFLHGLYNPDEAAIGVQAIAHRDGGRLYVDVADRKPPLPALAYEAVFRVTGSTDLRPVHAVAALFVAAGAAVLALDARRRYGSRAGWVTAVLAVASALAFLPADGQAANFAQFAFAPAAAAVVWCRRGTTGWALLGGLALGIAVLCRQSWIYGLVAAMAAAALSGRRRDAVAVATGTVAGVSLAALVAPFGEFWRWNVTGNGGFATAAFDLDITASRLVASASTFVGLHAVLVVLVACAGVRSWREPARRRDDADLWLWLVTGLAAVATGFHFYGHYWLQLVPAAVALSVAALFAGAERPIDRVAPIWSRVGGTVLVGTGVVALVFGFVPQIFRDDPDPTALARYVADHSDRGEPVLVWGNLAEVLLLADRPPGGALVHSDFVTGRDGNEEVGSATLDQATPGAFDQLMEQLESDPPALILDTSTADIRGYGDYPLALFPALHRFVADRYRLADRIDGVDVYAPVTG